MPETTSLPASLPPALSIAIIILTTIVSLAPKLFAMFSDVSGESRSFKREKERLNLLKLRYEIEAFKREKDLKDLTEPERHVVITRTITRTGEPLPFKISFLLGAIGAASPTILTLGIALFSRHSIPTFFSAYYWIGVILSSCLMGVLASFFPRRPTEPYMAFLVGLSFTLIFQLVGQNTIERSQEARPLKEPAKHVGSIAPKQGSDDWAV
jgi:hypothetical protein